MLLLPLTKNAGKERRRYEEQWWEKYEKIGGLYDDDDIPKIVEEAMRREREGTLEEVKNLGLRDPDDCAWILQEIEAKLTELKK